MQSMSHQVKGFGIGDARNAALGGVTTSHPLVFGHGDVHAVFGLD
jgi:hypothetical protein